MEENPFRHYKKREAVSKGPLQRVQPLEDGVLRVTMETGSVLDIPMQAHLDEPRLCPLREQRLWRSAETDGCFVRWKRDGVECVELSWDELMEMTLGHRWA